MTELLITADRLADGEFVHAVKNPAVVIDIESGTFAEVTHRDDVRPDRYAQHLHFPDATILPGLIDGHVHLCFNQPAENPADLADAQPADLLPGLAERAATMLRAGVTTVRDLGDRDCAALMLRDSAGSHPPLPRILAAGPPLTPPGGHCWFLGGAVDVTPDALRAQVDMLADRGVDWIKVMVSGGHITEGGAELWEAQFGSGDLEVVVDAATRRGLPVAAHAHSTHTATMAALAGVRTIEHCLMIDSEELRPNRDPEMARAIRDAGVFVCNGDKNDVDHWSRLTDPERAEMIFGRSRWLADQGITLFAGTDAGVHSFEQTVPGLLRRASQFGPPEILRLATTDAARALRIDDSVGRVSAGFSADLLIVAGDPLEDIHALADVRAVVARGQLITR